MFCLVELGIFVLCVCLGKVVIPERGSESFVSMIGHLDGRIDLYNAGDYGDLVFELGNRGLMDLCIMASKLAYENARVVRNVVVQHWKVKLSVCLCFVLDLIGML